MLKISNVNHHQEKTFGRLLSSVKKNVPAYMFLLPFLMLFCIFFIFPFFYGLYISFFRWNIFQPEKTSFVWLDNYIKILFNSESIYFDYFWNGMKNTILFVIISVPTLIFSALFVALLLDIRPFGYRFLRIVFFMPTVFSISAVALIWVWQFNTEGGFINEVLKLFHIEQVQWLTSQPWAWISILIVTVWWTMGTNMVILSAGLKDIDKSLYEAAEIDGASYWQGLRYISIPGIANQLFTVTILTTIASFNIYGQPDLLTSGGPVLNGEFTTTVLMMRIRGIAFGVNAQPGIASSMAVCLGIIMIVISLVQSKVIKKMGDQ